MAQRLVLEKPHGQLLLESYEVPEPQGSQIVLNVKATSLNHLDWKRIDKNLFIPTFPHVLGMDAAGIIVKAGPESEYAVGTRVTAPGSVAMSAFCSFQTHMLVDSVNCARIPESVEFAAASTLPFCLMTAAAGLYINLGLPFEADKAEPATVLIWGGNGNVGQLAIQLAKLSGYRVTAITSTEAAIATAKASGADDAFAANTPDLLSKIKQCNPHVKYAFDTVVTSETVEQVLQILEKQGSLATAIKYMGEVPGSITSSSVYSGEVMGKTMTGQPSAIGVQVRNWLWSGVPKWLEKDQMHPLAFRTLDGLEGIPKGLDEMKNHTAKGKLVAVLA